MGNESKPQDVDLETIRSMATIVRNALGAMENAISIAEKQGMNEIPVRQLPKGKRAIDGLLDFSNLLSKNIAVSLHYKKPTLPAFGEMVLNEQPDYKTKEGNKPVSK